MVPPPTEAGIGVGRTELRRLLEMTEKFCYYPPPTESRRLLEITEKTQEIQQAQLGSSGEANAEMGGLCWKAGEGNTGRTRQQTKLIL